VRVGLIPHARYGLNDATPSSVPRTKRRMQIELVRVAFSLFRTPGEAITMS
jgi:hypothetical protein